MTTSQNELLIGLVSISDRAAGGVYEDKGLPALQEWFGAALSTPWKMVTRLIPDEQPVIEATLKELVDYSRANPTALSYGSCGVGTPQHFVMELVKQKAGIQATNVCYKGCAPALTDVVGGQVQLAILSANLAAPHIKTGKLNGIGVSTAGRYALMPQVPSFEEQGLKPLDFSIWYALMGPAKMPADVVARIYADVQKVLAEPAVKETLSNAGVEPYAGSGPDLAKLIRADLARYAQLAKSANIKAE